MQITLCKVRETEEIYSLEEINKFDQKDPKLNDLVCPNCDCSLSYYPPGVKKAYLKTHNGQKHDESCDYYFVSVNKELLLHSDGVIRYKMGADEKRKRALQARKKLFEEMNSIGSTLKKNNLKKVSPRKTVKTKEEKRAKIQIVRDTSLAEPNVTEDMVKGRVRVPRKFVNEINANIAGKTINAIGFLKDIKIAKEQATLTLEYKQSELSVVLTEAFFTKASANYHDLLEIINQMISNDFLSIDVVVSGDVEIDNQGVYLAVYEDDDLYLRGLRTVQLAANYIQGKGV